MISIIGTIALCSMAITVTVNGAEKNLSLLKLLAFFTVLVCLWWKP